MGCSVVTDPKEKSWSGSRKHSDFDMLSRQFLTAKRDKSFIFSFVFVLIVGVSCLVYAWKGRKKERSQQRKRSSSKRGFR